MSRFAVIYWLDCGDKSPYLEMLYNSVKSLRKYDKEIDILVLSPKRLDFPFNKFNVQFVLKEDSIRKRNSSLPAKYGKYSFLDLNLKEYERIMFLDVDTFIRCNLTDLISRYRDFDFSIRKMVIDEDLVRRMNKLFIESGFKLILKREENKTHYNSGVFILNPKLFKKIKKNFLIELNKEYDSCLDVSIFGDKQITPLEEINEESRFFNSVNKLSVRIGNLSSKDHGINGLDSFSDSRIFHILSENYFTLMKKPFWRLRLKLGIF